MPIYANPLWFRPPLSPSCAFWSSVEFLPLPRPLWPRVHLRPSASAKCRFSLLSIAKAAIGCIDSENGRLFVTIRNYSPPFALFVLFAVHNSRLFAFRYSGSHPTEWSFRESRASVGYQDFLVQNFSDSLLKTKTTVPFFLMLERVLWIKNHLCGEKLWKNWPEGGKGKKKIRFIPSWSEGVFCRLETS